MRAHVLVATDGARESLGALRLAASLWRRGSHEVEVLTVLKPMLSPGLAGLEGIPTGYPEVQEAQAAALREAVHDQLRAVGEGAETWPVRVEIGSPAATIARYAAEHAAGLILLGSRPHGGTALQVVHLASAPVLVVPDTVTELPRRALVAVDFSDFSLDAARGVTGILAEGATVHLAHVAWAVPDNPLLSLVAQWNRTYNRGADERLEELARELELGAEVRVRSHVLEGDAVTELLDLADRLHVDVLAAGSHGYGFCGRVFIGSVSMKLLRGAACSVLLSPPRHRAAEAEPEPAAAERRAPAPEVVSAVPPPA